MSVLRYPKGSHKLPNGVDVSHKWAVALTEYETAGQALLVLWACPCGASLRRYIHPWPIESATAPDGDCAMTGTTDQGALTRCGDGWYCDAHAVEEAT
jgi:hypothetical protein